MGVYTLQRIIKVFLFHLKFSGFKYNYVTDSERLIYFESAGLNIIQLLSD